MLVVNAGEQIEIPFIYKSGYTYINTDDDIYVYLKRGYNTPGPIILGPLKYKKSLETIPTPVTVQQIGSDVFVEKLSTGSYTLKMTLPNNLYEGIYTVQITTTADNISDSKEYNVQCLPSLAKQEETYSLTDKKARVGNRSIYTGLGDGDTNSILLIGHTDAMEPLSIYKIASMQDGINILRADLNSPLLRGMFDAYSCGAKDIYIMSAGYMSEYEEDVQKRTRKVFQDNAANTYSFYEYYYSKLAACYEVLKDYEFIDIIVPLETSIVSTGGVNFVKQLSDHCQNVQENTGEVQMGVIGSRSTKTIEEDIIDLKNTNFNIQSEINNEGFILKDSGKYILLVYGECVFNHKQVQKSYTSSAAAAFSAVLASTRVDYGLAKKQIPGALSVIAGPITQSQIKDLTDIKINTITTRRRSLKNAPYNVIINNDLTMSISQNYADASNVRLVAMIIAEIQSLGYDSVGKFSYDKLIRNVDAMLGALKGSDIIRDYYLDAFADKLEVGKLYFNISITSSRTLRSISFNVATGKGM